MSVRWDNAIGKRARGAGKARRCGANLSELYSVDVVGVHHLSQSRYIPVWRTDLRRDMHTAVSDRMSRRGARAG